MPGQVVVLPGITDDEQRVLTALCLQLEFKQTRNRLRDCYYHGRLAIRHVGTIIPPQYHKLAIVLGWSAKAVDMLADRINLDGIVWPDGDLDSLGMQQLYDDNFLGVETNGAVIQSMLHGCSFFINTVGDPNIGEQPGLIHVKSAENATGIWNARARCLSNLLSVTARDQSGSITGLALYLPNMIITAQKDISGWTIDRTEHTWGVPAEPMVYRYRTDRPFGSSRISRPVMSLHDMALRTVIRMEGHADTYSFPEMWLLGADESIFKNADGSQKAVWQVMLGRIKAIPDSEEAVTDALARADVKQFQAASPQPHIDQLKQQAQLFSGETSIPVSSLGVSDQSNPTSADSYVASREDIIARAENATDDYTRPLQRTIARALAMKNGYTEVPPAFASIAPQWRSPIYLSRAAQADAGLKQLTAVPWLADTEVGLELLGMNPQQIARAMAAKKSLTVTQLIQAASAQANEAKANPLIARLAGQTSNNSDG